MNDLELHSRSSQPLLLDLTRYHLQLVACCYSISIQYCFQDTTTFEVYWHRRTPESKFTKFGEEMFIGQTPEHAKFCGDPTRSVRDIHDR